MFSLLPGVGGGGEQRKTLSTFALLSHVLTSKISVFLHMYFYHWHTNSKFLFLLASSSQLYAQPNCQFLVFSIHVSIRYHNVTDISTRIHEYAYINTSPQHAYINTSSAFFGFSNVNSVVQIKNH